MGRPPDFACKSLNHCSRTSEIAGTYKGAPTKFRSEPVAPGLIDTDITGGALEGDTKTRLLAGIPVGRNGQVADVADMITYLCREQTGYITGATHDINGGSHMH